MSQRVPNWVIRQLCTPFGARLPKHPDKWYPGRDYQANRSAWQPPMGPYRVVGGLQDMQAKMRRERDNHTGDYAGNLNGDEYRFFIGVPYIRSPFAMCRMCRTSVYNEMGRGAHNEVTGDDPCTTKLVRIYRDALIADKCMVCNTYAKRKSKWGVPLCSDQCIDEWMFNMRIQYPWEKEAPPQITLV